MQITDEMLDIATALRERDAVLAYAAKIGLSKRLAEALCRAATLRNR